MKQFSDALCLTVVQNFPHKAVKWRLQKLLIDGSCSYKVFFFKILFELDNT